MSQIIDCHAHICPDKLAERNMEIIKKFSGITPAYDGSVSKLLGMMNRAGVLKSLVNNTVLKPELMHKANDFTTQVVSKNAGRLSGMAWIVPGETESVVEAERCKGLGFSAFKMHNSHFKVMPADSRNDGIYEKIVEFNIPVLFHCGANPYGSSEATQYSAPKNFAPVLKSYPKMKVILGHLAGFQDFPDQAIELLSLSPNAVADTALDAEGKEIDMKSILENISPSKMVFGSDYPIHDGVHILDWLRHSLSPEDLDYVCCKNILNLIPM